MIETIPNYYPIFVHFTVALFSTAVGVYGLSFICARLGFFHPKTVTDRLFNCCLTAWRRDP